MTDRNAYDVLLQVVVLVGAFWAGYLAATGFKVSATAILFACIISAVTRIAIRAPRP